MKRTRKKSCEKKVSRSNKFGLVAFLLGPIKSLGCSTSSTLMPTGMGFIDPKFVKGGRKLKKKKHCIVS